MPARRKTPTHRLKLSRSFYPRKFLPYPKKFTDFGEILVGPFLQIALRLKDRSTTMNVGKDLHEMSSSKLDHKAA